MKLSLHARFEQELAEILRVKEMALILKSPRFFLLCLYVSKLLQDNCQIKIMLLHICSIIYCILHEVKLYSILKGHFLIKFA